MRAHAPFQYRRTWFGSRLVVLAATIASFMALAVAPPVLASSPRSGPLHITKECSQYTGLADSFCTITSSNVHAIAAGSRVVYFQASGATVLDSDVALVVGPGNLALGHVYLPGNGPGLVKLSGGTGKFVHFHVSAVVSTSDPLGIVWNWDGTYSFSPKD
jgi:hypothetical protein